MKVSLITAQEIQINDKNDSIIYYSYNGNHRLIYKKLPLLGKDNFVQRKVGHMDPNAYLIEDNEMYLEDNEVDFDHKLIEAKFALPKRWELPFNKILQQNIEQEYGNTLIFFKPYFPSSEELLLVEEKIDCFYEKNKDVFVDKRKNVNAKNMQFAFLEFKKNGFGELYVIIIVVNENNFHLQRTTGNSHWDEFSLIVHEDFRGTYMTSPLVLKYKISIDDKSSDCVGR